MAEWEFKKGGPELRITTPHWSEYRKTPGLYYPKVEDQFPQPVPSPYGQPGYFERIKKLEFLEKCEEIRDTLLKLGAA